MSVLTYTNIIELAQREAQCFVTTDPPFSSADLLVHANSAYQIVYEESGGGLIKANGMWDLGASAGTFCVAGSASTAEIAKPVNVLFSASSSETSADVPLRRVDLQEIFALKAASAGLGTYDNPKAYAIVRESPAPSGDTSTNVYGIYVWPPTVGATHYYVHLHYRRQFDPFDGGVSDVPDVNDVESYDIAYTMGAILAPLAGRAELVPAIVNKISREMQAKIKRRLDAQIVAEQQ